MSWRVVFEPFGPDEFDRPPTEWADWVIPEDADDRFIACTADEAAWERPLKVFIQRPDRRLDVFIDTLRANLVEDGDYRLICLEEEPPLRAAVRRIREHGDPHP